ncbi:hypothetical protein F2P81_013708 [Scophthalmus maximus]|uniref:Uncharacterized protein n=1 Tax=Scophthalmus maximus TaxID=52904 RepID=A0A6A4SU64_SCOMX|nr:hypothetical protein F2P81_013708 [Scophthalmus maximus]
MKRPAEPFKKVLLYEKKGTDCQMLFVGLRLILRVLMWLSAGDSPGSELRRGSTSYTLQERGRPDRVSIGDRSTTAPDVLGIAPACQRECRVCSRHSDKTETISSLYPSTIRRKSKARFWWEKISTAFEVFHEKLYTVKTSVDAIWRSREHCCFSVREGTRRRGSIKAITTFRSKCSAMPGTKKNKKCGNSRLKDPVSVTHLERYVDPDILVL